TAGGKGSAARPNHLFRLPPGPPFSLSPFPFFFLSPAFDFSLSPPAALRGIIEIALYGHCVAQSAHPMQGLCSMYTGPAGKRAIEPVGHPVRHSGSLQCRQTAGASTL